MPIVPAIAATNTAATTTHGITASTSLLRTSGSHTSLPANWSTRNTFPRNSATIARAGAEQRLRASLDQERNADAPVRRSDQPHDADLLAAREHPHPQRVRDEHDRTDQHDHGKQEQTDRERVGDGRETVEHVPVIDDARDAGLLTGHVAGLIGFARERGGDLSVLARVLRA